MDSGTPQSFDRVDVADTGDQPLVEEKALQRCAACVIQRWQKIIETRVERFDAESCKRPVGVLFARLEPIDKAKSAGVYETQLASVLEIEEEMGVIAKRRGGIYQLDAPRHAEVGEERSWWFEIEQQVFTASSRLPKPTTGRERREPFNIKRAPHGDRLTTHGHDLEPGHLERKGTAYGLDFGELGHGLTRILESGVAQTVESGHHLVWAWSCEIAIRPPAEPPPVPLAQPVEHELNCGQRLA